WVASADMADPGAAQEVVDGTVARFGALHGVIHAAGVVGERAFHPLATTGRSESEEQFRPKVYGLYALASALADRQLDFCLLTSSLSAVLGGLGFAAYAAANAFADAYVQWRNRDAGTPWLSVDWDGWHWTPPADTTGTELGLTPQEGVETLRRLLAQVAVAAEDRMIVSTGDLTERARSWLRVSAKKGAGQAVAGETLEDTSRPTLATPYAAPRNAIEEAIAEIWQGLLGVSPIGVHDDFFELGGHSLLATQVLTRLRDRFDRELDLGVLFDRPTVAALAERVRDAQVIPPSESTALGEALVPEPRRDNTVLPLSYAQQRMWFIEQLEPGGSAYILLSVLRFNGALDIQALDASLQSIVGRHEALRTCFPTRQGQPVQQIAASLRIALPRVDLSGLSGQSRQAEALRLAAEEGRRPFDLARGPLLRILLLRLADDEHVVASAMHHIVSDAWSMEILSRELAFFYAAKVRCETPSLPGLRIQYADYARWQERWLEQAEAKAQLEYWTRQLQALPPLKLPTDFARPRERSFAGAIESHTIEVSVRRELARLAQSENASLFMVFLALFDVLFHQASGQQDIVVGSNLANRNRGEVEDLIGCFINSVVLRSDLSGNPTFRELLRRVRRVTLDAYTHQDLPFEKLVEALNPQRDFESQPLFQIKLDMQAEGHPIPRLPNLEVNPVVANTPELAHSDLIVYLTETEGRVELQVHYRTDLFKPSRMRQMVTDLDSLIGAVCRQPENTLAELRKVIEVSQQRRSDDRKKEFERSLKRRLKRGRVDRQRAKRRVVKT
ncbi:MAG: condensation domain-containing protein, partial [Acidobacteriota bacterium]